VDAEIFRDLKQLDERLQTAATLLEYCTVLFDKCYSETDRKNRLTFSWPYSIQGKEGTPRWPSYGKPLKKRSPSTAAICGFGVSLLNPGGETGERLRKDTTEAAQSLAKLPLKYLVSPTFQDDIVFPQAQVLRFLAAQGESKSDLFKNLLREIRNVVARPHKKVYLHPFYLHYCVLALEQVGFLVRKKVTDKYNEQLRSYLRTELVSQISYAASSDRSRLDIGALTYSLAAGLRSAALSPASPLARKALSIIFEHQQGGLWSDIQPMSRTKEGFVHFPLNIEIANALLSILLTAVDAEVSDSWVKKIDEIMDWVGGTVNKAGDFRGWCNEHDYAPDRIDLWVTAQVVQFLSGYADLRSRLVIRSAIERAGLVTIQGALVSMPWDKLDPPDLEKRPGKRILNELEKNIVKPFKETGVLGSSSILLYGPPGTSKTSLMEALAQKMDWQFLQVTPADFLLAGAEQVEARATLLFEILKRAKDLVVLFDEIDEFLVDREAKDRPGGIFRFMTTSMLPKLQSLKSRRKLIFGIATNYKERLDEAITRLGRVDHVWAVLPPDFESRVALIQKFEPNIDDALARSISANTPFFSYLELKRAVSVNAKSDPWKIIRHPTARPVAYINRPGSDEELLALLNTQLNDLVISGASAVTKKALKSQLKELEQKSIEDENLFDKATVKRIRKSIEMLG